jgi:hypothetical protein
MYGTCTVSYLPSGVLDETGEHYNTRANSALLPVDFYCEDTHKKITFRAILQFGAMGDINAYWKSILSSLATQSAPAEKTGGINPASDLRTAYKNFQEDACAYKSSYASKLVLEQEDNNLTIPASLLDMLILPHAVTYEGALKHAFVKNLDWISRLNTNENIVFDNPNDFSNELVIPATQAAEDLLHDKATSAAQAVNIDSMIVLLGRPEGNRHNYSPPIAFFFADADMTATSGGKGTLPELVLAMVRYPEDDKVCNMNAPEYFKNCSRRLDEDFKNDAFSKADQSAFQRFISYYDGEKPDVKCVINKNCCGSAELCLKSFLYKRLVVVPAEPTALRRNYSTD